jgi:aldehyde dehydrogenase (NAD+)
MTIPELVRQQRIYFNTNTTRDIAFRISQLKLLKSTMKKHEKAMLDAVYADLRKSRYDTTATELSLTERSGTPSAASLLGPENSVCGGTC